jgi:hypothetical protein
METHCKFTELGRNARLCPCILDSFAHASPAVLPLLSSLCNSALGQLSVTHKGTWQGTRHHIDELTTGSEIACAQVQVSDQR